MVSGSPLACQKKTTLFSLLPAASNADMADASPDATRPAALRLLCVYDPSEHTARCR
jgi:hypothetical protein